MLDLMEDVWCPGVWKSCDVARAGSLLTYDVELGLVTYGLKQELARYPLI